MSELKITAQIINELLQNKHGEDIYVSQCKTGASWNIANSHLNQYQLLILDGWAMKKKWAKPLVIGYEIKVNRSDFIDDDKWHKYLPYCNQLYFVCPSGIIAPNELPAEVGLLFVSKTGTKLFEKKKAIYRDVQIPESIFRYILMSRTKITRDSGERGKKEFWKEWLKDKEKCKDFGYMVSNSIRRELEDRVEKVDKKNRELQNKIREFEGIKKIIDFVGMDPEKVETWHFHGDFKKKIEELRKGFPEGFDKEIESVLVSLKKIYQVICQ